MTSRDEPASKVGRRAIATLLNRGTALGFDVGTEIPVQGGRIDVVWFLRDVMVPDAPTRLPAVAFEVESSWRTRKHVKGDYLNLADLGASLGVILLLGTGDDVESLRRFARILVDRPGPRIVVWSEAQLDELAAGKQEPLPTDARLDDGAESREHPGKYHRLWAWLRDQPGDRLETTFAEIEETVGLPLPPSSRRHPAHWHSYQGSAVVRAIHDAGWRAHELSLEAERVTLIRTGDEPA